MEVAIAGAHGQIARRLTRLLAARGDRVHGLIRNPDHTEDVRSDGADPVVCDLERATPEEIAAAQAADVPRYVIVSSIGAESPPEGDDVFSAYLRAKAEADAAVRASDRRWTIVRPGRLTDEPGTGRVRLDTEPFRGEVSRDDVTAVLAAVLAEPQSRGATLYVNGGDVPIAEALATALG